MRPFGVFGGMFDPIHYGHLRTAHELHELLGLEAVAFVPAGDPPHRAAPLADAATRLEMVRAAVGDDPRFLVDDRELRRARPVLHDPDARGDARRARRAAARADPRHGCVRGHRPLASRRGDRRARPHRDRAASASAGCRSDGLAAALLRERRCEDPARLADSPAGLVHVSENTQLDLSSSAVRAVIAGGRDPRYLMPEAARRIILARGSYARPGDKKE